MILATYQCLDYLSYKNNRYKKLKNILEISEDTNLYWCISANNIYQIIINSYTIEANQPNLFILFETNNFYKIDGIKWNHYVETQDESLLTKDLLNIEHEDTIEYIVTNIPNNKFEINTTPNEMLDALENINGKYTKSIQKYQGLIIQGLENYPTREEIDNITLQASYEVDTSLLILAKYFIAFKFTLLVPFYLIGMDYLGHTIKEMPEMKIIQFTEAPGIIINHNQMYKNYENEDILYKNYKDFYNYIYKKIFIQKKIYPNDLCPCNSGLKYKKCCMKNNKLLYKQMISV